MLTALLIFCVLFGLYVAASGFMAAYESKGQAPLIIGGCFFFCLGVAFCVAGTWGLAS